jgi:RNA-binding protein 8A
MAAVTNADVEVVDLDLDDDLMDEDAGPDPAPARTLYLSGKMKLKVR